MSSLFIDKLQHAYNFELLRYCMIHQNISELRGWMEQDRRLGIDKVTWNVAILRHCRTCQMLTISQPGNL